MTLDVLNNLLLERPTPTSIRISWEKPFSLSAPFSIGIYKSPFSNSMEAKRDAGRNDGIHPMEIPDLDPDQRYYVEVSVDGKDRFIWGERKVSCEGTFNFRDLGGYETRAGWRVKWGRIFRSDGLANLTERGLRQFRHVGISRVIDLRTRDEVAAAPDKFPPDMIISYDHLPVRHGEFNFIHAMKRLKNGDAGWLSEDYMVKGYLNSLSVHAKTWGSALEKIALTGDAPVLFHCTGGKDRTGTLSALLLLSLDVPAETVVFDHQLSNGYIEEMLPFVFEKVKSYGLDPEQVRPYFTAPVNGIRAVISHISNTFGHAERYLVDQCGLKMVHLKRLKKILLEA